MKYLLIFALAFALIQPAVAQDDQLDDFKFEDEPGSETELAYFAAAGGYLATLFFPNFDDLNSVAQSRFGFGADAFKSPVYVQGGEGFVAFPYIKNSRIGFFGIAGGKSLDPKDVKMANPLLLTDSISAKRYLDYHVSFTGVSLDYALMFGKKFTIVPNVRGGFGSMIIQSYQGTTERSWDDFKPEGTTVNYLNRLEADYLFVQPGVHFEFAATPFFMLRASGGYTLSFMPSEWDYNYASKVNDVPSGIKASGLTAQIGIFLGLFQ
ncbi:MAG: hypothetical protein V4642_13670 [Bacteroidota bacterium]